MISVIIPCYNSASTILRALKSLEKQTYCDFEVVVINDGSSDGTQLKVEAYKKDSKLNILFFTQNNLGVSAARNNGIKKSNGEYICFLDADDEYDHNFLKFMSELVIDNKLDFSVCRFKYDNESVDGVVDRKNDIISKYDAINMFKNKRTNKINMWSFLYKKSIIMDNSLIFSENLKYGEDTEFVCKYLFHCNNGGVNVNSQLYIYYIVAGSAMHKVTYDRVQNVYAFKNIVSYWENDVNWNSSLGEYFINRAIWAVAKDFAMDNKELFEKFYNEFDVYNAMKYMSKYSNEKLVKITANLYCVNKTIFRLINLVYKLISKNS